jgi:hypothetical protein
MWPLRGTRTGGGGTVAVATKVLSIPLVARKEADVRAVQDNTGFQLHKGSPDSSVREACLLGKLYRQPFKSIDKRKAVSFLEVIHLDVMGPMPTESLGGNRYAIAFTDELSRYTMVYFMAKKEERRPPCFSNIRLRLRTG